jgi:hypothetical protein
MGSAGDRAWTLGNLAWERERRKEEGIKRLFIKERS